MIDARDHGLVKGRWACASCVDEGETGQRVGTKRREVRRSSSPLPPVTFK
ncbi:uncharacterized protein SOCEGT47_006000 [Sorangium cellulosum]|uniref:Uncharacterized protein n=1 Tax=Sorangium cellulosum TaxID=56 RepID=A0A4P2PTZ6_SORCE|nr:uncharacterized protein SOCEGT47_006000 [Sorangium cellulosum]